MVDYIIANVAGALPLSLLGLVAIYFRKSKLKAVLSGLLGAISLPILSFLANPLGQPDSILFSAIIGSGFGYLVHVLVNSENGRH